MNDLNHLRAKAIELRAENKSLLDICDLLKLSKSTVYYWIKDLPYKRMPKPNLKQSLLAKKKRADDYSKYKLLAPQLITELDVRDFTLLYLAEGYRKHRNQVAICNSNPAIMQLSYKCIKRFAKNKIDYRLRLHVDHDEAVERKFWADKIGIMPDCIKFMPKANSNQLKGRKFRSEHGILTIRTADTEFRSLLQALMDTVQEQW